MTHDKPEVTTTDAGIPVESDEFSLTVGPNGPVLLHDHYLIEQMANFNRERIPERQPHAKGGGAFGHFQVTSDVSNQYPDFKGTPSFIINGKMLADVGSWDKLEPQLQDALK